MPLADIAPAPHVWRLSGAWARKRHDCTLAGIIGVCGAACCYAGPGGTRWPARAYGPGNQRCGWLGDQGCTLGDARPVTCLLYPFKVNAAGTIVLHHRTVGETSCCAGNHGQGPMLIDAMRGSFTVLFGALAYDRARAAILAGRDAVIPVPDAVWDAYAREAGQEAANSPPVARPTARQ